MRDKIVFFVIGAVLSVLAFLAGSQQNNKQDTPSSDSPSELNVKTIECKELRVEDIIWVGRAPNAMIVIEAGGEKSIAEGAEELGTMGLGPDEAAISMISGFGDKDALGRDVLSQIMLSTRKGSAGIHVDSNSQAKNPRAGSISINAWNAGAAQLKVKSGDKEEKITVTAD